MGSKRIIEQRSIPFLSFAPRCAALAVLLIAMLVVAGGAAAQSELVVDGTTVVLDGAQSYSRVSVLNGGVLTHAPVAATGVGLDLQVSGEVFVDASSAIDVSGKGYAAGQTLGNNEAAGGRSGGSHGGLGFTVDGATNAVYGDLRDPRHPGSGAARDRDNGGAGGGAIRISAGTLRLAGRIRADGADGIDPYPNGGGGGSGGSISIDVGVLRGSGSISADGGKGKSHCYYGCRAGGGGGGGRIAVRFATNDGFDLSGISAVGGENATYDAGPGASGTIYLQARGQPSEIHVRGAVAEAGTWTPLGLPGSDLIELDRLFVAGPGVVVAPHHDMPLLAQEVTLSAGAVLTHPPASHHEWFALRLIISGTLTIAADAAIDVSGRGYALGRGAFNRWLGAAGNLGGGSYGGLGGYSSNFAYGDAMNPDQPGAGGALGSGRGGAGGGLVRISAAAIRVDGMIRANGADGRNEERGQPAGSGGGVLLNAAMLSGSGSISADGGRNGVVCYYGCRFGGSGGGGRVAIYSNGGGGLVPAQVTVAGGSGDVPGTVGTIERPEDPRFVWSFPAGSVLRGTRQLVWESLGIDAAATTVEVVAAGAQSYVLATNRPGTSTFAWNTTSVPDGRYDLRATFRDGFGATIGVARRTVLVVNTLPLHGGRITASESWGAGSVHVVTRSVSVASGATLTIEPGTVVKFAPAIGIVLEDGGGLEAAASPAAPVVLTSLSDDTTGGDTNGDGGASLPRLGDWDGLLTQGSAQANLGADVSVRYARMGHSGRLMASETWQAASVHEILDDVVLAEGTTVTVEPGTRIELGRGRGMSLERNAYLVASGTVQKPIVFTSIRDGLADSAAEAGDWHWIDVAAGRADFEHCRIRYGGGTPSGNWEETGVLRTTTSTAALTLKHSVVEDIYFDGVLVWGGTATLENVLLRGIDRAVSAHPGGTVQVINSTIDDNRIGLLTHGGVLSAVNTIVSNSYESGVQYDFGAQPVVRYSNIWSAAPGALSYRNTVDRTGSGGNTSVDPRYKDRTRGNYRLAYLSPAIDAADGAMAPLTDLAGAARYDDPRSPNTGIPTASGAFADLGAYELVESADSDVDLVVTDVRGPQRATAGERVLVEWTVHNAGSGSASGPWRDTIYLVTTIGAETIEVEAAEIEVAGGLALAPGETRTFQAEVIVPGARVGEHAWQVKTNSRGDVFEGRHDGNNGGRSLASVSVQLAPLPLDAVVEGDLTAGRWASWYAFFAPYGTEYDLELEVDRISPQVVVYARRNLVASEQEYDWRTAPGPDLNRRLRIPGGPEGYVYMLVTTMDTPTPPLRFSLRLRQRGAFELTDVGPAVVCNAGRVTLELRGSGFTPRSAARLVGGGEELAAVEMFYADSATVYATFSVQGLAAGLYDVVLRDQRLDIGADGSADVVDLSAGRSGALSVVAGAGGRIEAQISTRNVQRAGRPFDALLTYRNSGCADLTAPLLLVRAAGARFLIDEEPFVFVDTAQVMGVSSTGPAGRLRVGQEESVRLVVTPPLGVASFEITVTSAAPGPGGPDLDAVADFLLLPLDTEWGQSVLGNLRELAGTTWASYEAALVNAADELSYGYRSPSVATLLKHLAAVSAPPLAAAASSANLDRDREEISQTTAMRPPPPGHTRFDPWPSGPEFDYDARRIEAFKSNLRFIAAHVTLFPPWIPGGLHLQHFLDGSGAPLSYGPTDYFTETLKQDPSFKTYLSAGRWRRDVRVAAKYLAEPLECGQAVRMPVTVTIDLPEDGGALPGWLNDPGGQAIGGVDKAVIELDLYVMRRENDIQVVGRGKLKFSDFYHWAGHQWYHDPSYDPPWNWWATYIEYWGAAKGFFIEVDFGDVLTVEETISGDSIPRKECDKLQFVPEPPPGFVLDATGVRLAGSYDPNDKAAPGYGPLGWLRDDPLILYTVRFENRSTATAPAQEVSVTDVLSPDLDWSTFQLVAIGFNDKLIDVPPGRQSHTEIAQVGSDPNPVRVLAELNPDSGRLLLYLRSEDPVTRDLPDDPFAGFLPPNDSEHHGEGFIRFTVKPRAGLPDATRIRNQARIVFDVNEPIDTNETVNSIGFPPPPCTGDCDGSGTVSIDDLISGVDVALGKAPGGDCAAADSDGDGQVTIDELIASVNSVRGGCPVPTPRPTLTPTWTQPAVSVTPTRTVTSSPTRTSSATHSPTATLTVPAATHTPSPTQSRTATKTMAPPATATPSPTHTLIPSPTPTTTPGPVTLEYCDGFGSREIPDDDPLGTAGFIDVPDDFAIEEVKVRVQIGHSWVGDLNIVLDHVDTLSSVTLLDRPGMPASLLGCPENDVGCVFDDAAEMAAEDSCSTTSPALGGTLRPAIPLAAFRGERGLGTWMLVVVDAAPGDTGSLDGWCLEMLGTSTVPPTPTPTF